MSSTSLAATNVNCKALIREFIEFLNDAVTPFHAVEAMKRMLLKAGYLGLSEREVWNLKQGGKYFVSRNGSALVAFAVGGKYEVGNGMKLVGAHTDSPNLALKPKSQVKKGDFLGVGVQLYGGGLWHTWFDRDLTVAGRVVVQENGSPSHLRTVLLNLKRPLLWIPSLAIHFRTADERDKAPIGRESHVVPMIATERMAAASVVKEEVEKQASDQSAVLFKLLADASKCDPNEIIDFDLSIVDSQPSTVGGAFDEFVFSPRLDNLISCFCGTVAMIESDRSIPDDSMIRIFGAFDNEEVGSETCRGAAGSLVPDVIERLCAPNASEKRAVMIAKSFVMSVDCSHCLHPNYQEKYEDHHKPVLHGGPAIKYNANSRYSTTGVTAAIVRALAKFADVPLQSFVVRNDSPCGSTIGPILTTLTGIRGVDIGNPMLSMHSCRESAGTVDTYYLKQLLVAFYERFNEISVTPE